MTSCRNISNVTRRRNKLDYCRAFEHILALQPSCLLSATIVPNFLGVYFSTSHYNRKEQNNSINTNRNETRSISCDVINKRKIRGKHGDTAKIDRDTADELFIQRNRINNDHDIGNSMKNISFPTPIPIPIPIPHHIINNSLRNQKSHTSPPPHIAEIFGLLFNDIECKKLILQKIDFVFIMSTSIFTSTRNILLCHSLRNIPHCQQIFLVLKNYKNKYKCELNKSKYEINNFNDNNNFKKCTSTIQTKTKYYVRTIGRNEKIFSNLRNIKQFSTYENSSNNGNDSTKRLLRLFLFQIHPDYFLQVSTYKIV